MSGVSRLSAAQQQAEVRRAREGRLNTAAMGNRLRRALGLMDRQQAAEHERLTVLPHTRLAVRAHGPDPEDIWVSRDLPLPAGGGGNA